MKELTINLADRYKAAFGMVAQNVIPRALKYGAQLIGKQANLGIGGQFFYFNIDTFDPVDPNFDNILLRSDEAGIEVKFGDMPFLKGKSITNDIIEKITGLFGGDEDPTGTIPVFAPPPMISFSKEKKLGTTEVGGGNDEVIENYGHKAWEIKMQGLLVDMVNHHYPLEQDKMLTRIFDADVIYEVQSQLMQAKGIYNVVFRKINTSPIQGYTDTLKYTLYGRSHKGIESTIEFLEQEQNN